jgi:hypothetical protein
MVEEKGEIVLKGLPGCEKLEWIGSFGAENNDKTAEISGLFVHV